MSCGRNCCNLLQKKNRERGLVDSLKPTQHVQNEILFGPTTRVPARSKGITLGALVNLQEPLLDQPPGRYEDMCS
jgi:hypothetical protein